MKCLHNCKAPAKINLFLHITGKRFDGYHFLQSAFQLINLEDTLHFNLRNDNQILRKMKNVSISESEDLIIKAVNVLKKYVLKKNFGVEIIVEKKIPIGSGLGGASSNAATTLIALNYLWNIGLSKSKLMELGLKLGADLPFFLHGQNAFVEGIGDKITPINSIDFWFVILYPNVVVSTSKIFSRLAITNYTKEINIKEYVNNPNLYLKNDLEICTKKHYFEISEAIDFLSLYGKARISGSGSSVFITLKTEFEANEILKIIPKKWSAWKVKSLQKHPMANLIQT